MKEAQKTPVPVTLIGSGPANTIIEGEDAMPAIIVTGTGVFLGLQGLRFAAGNGPEPVLQTVSGGEILFAIDIEIGRIPAIFSDGFE